MHTRKGFAVWRFIAWVMTIGIILNACIVPVWAYNGDVTVYVTDTGECYHRSGCSYLHSSNARTLKSAVESGYRACFRCSPPTLGLDLSTDTLTYQEYRNRGSASYGSGSRHNSNSSTNMGKGYANREVNPILIFGSALVLWIGINTIHRKAEEKKRKIETERQINLRRAQLIQEWGGLSQREIADCCGVPPDVEFGANGLPYLAGATTEDDPFVVYTTATGSLYHANSRCSHARTLRPTHVFHMRRGLIACSKCCPIIPNYTPWFQKYSRVMYELKRYQITPPETIDITDRKQLLEQTSRAHDQ